MGADTRALRTRIKSVNSTRHLTSAMGLVASSKIRRADQNMRAAVAYADAVQEVMTALLSAPECARSRYAAATGDRTRLIVIAGDRGLAGGYNANVFRLAATLPDAEVIPIGRRACDRYGAPFVSSEHFASEDANRLAKTLCADFAAGRFDRLAIIDTHYVSLLTQQARLRTILPLQRPEKAETHAVLFEPSETAIWETAVREYVAGMLMAAVRESFASEVAARRTAMDSADKNAVAMIDRLTLAYNQARLSAFTQEITEIVAGRAA